MPVAANVATSAGYRRVMSERIYVNNRYVTIFSIVTFQYTA